MNTNLIKVKDFIKANPEIEVLSNKEHVFFIGIDREQIDKIERFLIDSEIDFSTYANVKALFKNRMYSVTIEGGINAN